MQYYSVKVIVDEVTEEMLQYQFHSLGASGVLEEEEGFTAYFNDKDYNEESLKETIISLNEFYDFDFEISTFEEKNWNKEWEESYKPLFVEDYCAIYAPFHKKEGVFKHELTINPEMAFGTGHHETTQLMIAQIRDLDFVNKSVLDLGSGTGILAILAKKEKASEVLAVDIDPQAVKIMNQNFITNNTSEIRGKLGTSEEVEGQFDIILANINRNVLLEESDKITNSLLKNGYLILSGFYVDDRSIIKERYTNLGLKEVKKVEKNKWCSLIFKK